MYPNLNPQSNVGIAVFLAQSKENAAALTALIQASERESDARHTAIITAASRLLIELDTASAKLAAWGRGANA